MPEPAMILLTYIKKNRENPNSEIGYTHCRNEHCCDMLMLQYPAFFELWFLVREVGQSCTTLFYWKGLPTKEEIFSKGQRQYLRGLMHCQNSALKFLYCNHRHCLSHYLLVI